MRTMIAFFLGAFGGMFVGFLFAAMLFAERGVEQASAAYREVIREYVAENAKLRELLTFYLGCLTKGHVNCESCAISGENDCGHGRMVIERARELGVEVSQ